MKLFRLFSRPKKIRKQVYELTSVDLETASVWEFCLDEEGEAGQDEATVKPLPDVSKICDLDGSQIAKTEFTFGDGKKAFGYVYASSEETIPAIQPVVLTPQGQVMFWYGIVPPDEKRLAESLERLRSVSERPFPVRYSCMVPTDDIPLDGDIHGFYYYSRSREILVIKR